MLEITIPKHEEWDEEIQKFVGLDKDYVLSLEHSLVSISKWEQKWHKPFLSEDKKTYEQTCDYIRCMNLTEGVPDEVFVRIPTDVVDKVNEYIKDPATATWFTEDEITGKGSGKGRNKKEVVTNEIVYYWMIELHIPESFQYWHFNRLMTLIRVIDTKHEEADPNSKKRMSRNDILARNAKLNAARRKAMHSKG